MKRFVGIGFMVIGALFFVVITMAKIEDTDTSKLTSGYEEIECTLIDYYQVSEGRYGCVYVRETTDEKQYGITQKTANEIKDSGRTSGTFYFSEGRIYTITDLKDEQNFMYMFAIIAAVMLFIFGTFSMEDYINDRKRNNLATAD